MSRNRGLIFCAIGIAGCAADLVTKAWIFSWPELEGGQVHWLWPGHVGIQLSWNQGALFGMGQGGSWLFASLSILAGIAVPTWLFWFGAARDKWLTVALGCVMAGILGNLYDRLGLPATLWPRGAIDTANAHGVRDWILWQWNDQWRWPNFNIADSMLVAGASVLFWHALVNPTASGESVVTSDEAHHVG